MSWIICSNNSEFEFCLSETQFVKKGLHSIAVLSGMVDYVLHMHLHTYPALQCITHSIQHKVKVKVLADNSFSVALKVLYCHFNIAVCIMVIADHEHNSVIEYSELKQYTWGWSILPYFGKRKSDKASKSDLLMFSDFTFQAKFYA